MCPIRPPSLSGPLFKVGPQIRYEMLTVTSTFLTHNLPLFARLNPSIEIHVSPRPHTHPVIRAHYISAKTNNHLSSHPTTNNTPTKAICVRNLDPQQVLQKAELLRDGNGEKNRKVKAGRVVRSENESVRGIWSPMHGPREDGGNFFAAAK